jgi:selenocysteine-specific elongation factor
LGGVDESRITKHCILATAGHVDHGKSSLVKALTGTDPDRLPEEKARGITIELGFAHLLLDEEGTAPVRLDVGIVDVPGHEDFVKNMVAGVGAIDAALLVVAADDGWMPQTEEHLQILAYLGVKRAVVAVTKIDLAPAGEESIIEAIRPHLEGSPFADAPLIPTSVLSGAGLADLKSALAKSLRSAPTSEDAGKPRLPIDRVFSLHGIGTVVTGTLHGGSFRRGQAVVVQPLGKGTRIRTIQSHNCELESVGPGTRTALSLADVVVSDAAKGAESPGVRRGQIVTLAEFGAASSIWDVVVEKSARLIGSKAPAARPLKDGARIRVHHGSGNAPGRVVLLDRKEILPGESALAQLRLDTPMFIFAGDRFIIRDWAEQVTLAGGTVLDPDASTKGFRNPGRQEALRRLAATPGDIEVAAMTMLEGVRVGVPGSLLVQSRFSSREIAVAVDRLCETGKLVSLGSFVADSNWWKKLRQAAIEAVQRYHREHAEEPGLPLNQLRSALASELPVSEVFDALLGDLLRSGFSRVSHAVRQDTHRPALPPHLQLAGARLRATLAAKPFDPPSRKELAADGAAQQALRFLIQSGEAAEVGPDIVLLADAHTKATELIKKYLCERSRATVSELRQALGASRRIVVPLLEKLDREGVTRREGDFRVLKKVG